MIKFSIITITYNAESCLRRTLDSVLVQSYTNVEHIIVDGASTDATLAIANEYRNQSESHQTQHEVAIHSEPDRGLYDAMNKGLRLATGDYIVYLNAGDTLHDSDTLINLYKQVEDSNIYKQVEDSNIYKQIENTASPATLPAVVYGDTDLTDNYGNIIGHRRLSPPEHLNWKSFRHGMLVCHQSFYARLDIAKRFSYDLQYRHSADVDWCIRIMKEAEKLGLPLHNTHLVLSNYQKEGQTTVNHRASLLERFHVMSRHYGLFSTLLMHAWFVLRAVFRP